MQGITVAGGLIADEQEPGIGMPRPDSCEGLRKYR